MSSPMSLCGEGSWRNQVSPDLAIEWKDAIVDLSNLVLMTTGIKPTPSPVQEPSLSSRRPRKPRELKRLYPTERMLQSTEAAYKDATGKCKNRLSHPALFQQHSSFTRRTKKGEMTTYSTRDYEVLSLGPGAYEFIPEDEHENLKPVPKPGLSKLRNSIETEETNAVDFHGHNKSFDDYSFVRGPVSEPVPPARPRTDLQIEISPGVFARLRGSEETWNAIQSGNSTRAKCFSCELALLCISDAEYVICPSCRVVSPIATGNYGQERLSNNRLHRHTGGVGLGMQAY